MGFQGGDKLRKALEEIQAKVNKREVVRVGFLEKATYPDGTSVGQVAFWLEYGTENMPPRPFFSSMIAANKTKWDKALGKLLIANNYDVRKSLELMGEGMSGQLRRSIKAFDDPADSEKTLNAKRISVTAKRPRREMATLVDSGHMLASVDYEVSE